MSNFESFTSLDSFSKLTKYPQIFPSPMRPWRSTHPYSRYFSDTNEVTILVLFISVGPTTYPSFDNKVNGDPAITQLRRIRTQRCRWQLKNLQHCQAMCYRWLLALSTFFTPSKPCHPHFKLFTFLDVYFCP